VCTIKGGSSKIGLLKQETSVKQEFKVGDKVRWTDGDGTYWSHNGIYEIVDVTEHYYAITSNRNRSTALYPATANQFELVVEGTEARLQALLKKANEGRDAAQELYKLAPKRLEWSDEHTLEPQDLLFRFQLAPLKPAFKPFTLPDTRHKVTLDGHVLHVGCRRISASNLKEALYNLLTLAASSHRIPGLELQATRTGIWTEYGSITWADAELLYDKIKEL
jgi:hypothetical protein